MLHLCDSTVAGSATRRDNVVASKCEYPLFRYAPFEPARYFLVVTDSFLPDAPLLLTVGGVLPAIELLTSGAFYLQLELIYLQWEYVRLST